MFFAKIPRGVKAFRKNCLRGESPYFGFYCVFINKCFEICLRGVLYLPSPPHLSCVHLSLHPLVLFAVVAAQSWLDFYKGKSIIADNRVLTQVTGQQFSQFIQIILFRETGKQ
jgi:hypothetical protein